MWRKTGDLVLDHYHYPGARSLSTQSFGGRCLYTPLHSTNHTEHTKLLHTFYNQHYTTFYTTLYTTLYTKLYTTLHNKQKLNCALISKLYFILHYIKHYTVHFVLHYTLLDLTTLYTTLQWWARLVFTIMQCILDIETGIETFKISVFQDWSFNIETVIKTFRIRVLLKVGDNPTQKKRANTPRGL